MCCYQSEREDKVQAIATLIEKKAQIMMKPRIVSEEEKQRKAVPLATYADVTDKDNKACEKDDSAAVMMNIGSGKSLLQNTNVEDAPSAGKLGQDTLG